MSKIFESQKLNKEFNEQVKSFLNSNSKFSQFLSDDYTILPGFIDVHVHLREPGYSYKETIKTGTNACAHGGYTAVCSMPNLKPVPDCIENLKVQTDIIERDGVIDVYPYGAITVGQLGKTLSDMSGLSDKVIAFTDDGKGVQTDEQMLSAMEKAKELNKMIVAHCEVEELLKGGYIHDGKYAKEHGHLGICSESEFAQVARDIELVRETGCTYHVCHVSTKESVDIIRKAKSAGLNVTCETAPHYLVLDDSDLIEDGRWKMNPPLRSREDRLALINGILDGTIDMIATDHAPHSSEEKSKGLKGSPFGIVGIETAFQILYTYLVKTEILSLEKLMDLICFNPSKRFNIPIKGFSVWNLNEVYKIDTRDFLSMGKATPFAGKTVIGVNYLTVLNGKAVYSK